MIGVQLPREVKYYPLDGYEAVEEIIYRSWVGGVHMDFGIEKKRSEFFYKQIQYATLEAALAAQKRDYDEDHRETQRNQMFEIEHPLEGQESIIQVSEYQLTFVKGEERRRQLIREHFRFHGKNYTSLELAMQARFDRMQNNALHNQANGYAIESVFLLKGQASINAAAKAMDALKKLIEKTSGSQQSFFKIQRAEINRHYQAELLIEKASQKINSLDSHGLHKKIHILQEVKDLYAMAMDLKSIKQDLYRSERSKISLLKTNLEKDAQTQALENQLHREAKALARIARDNLQIVDFDRALDKYAQLITLQTKNSLDYKHERAALYQEKINKEAESNALENQLHREAKALARIARDNLQVADFDRALDKYAQLITLQTKNSLDYKHERAALYQEKINKEAESNALENQLHREAKALARIARDNLQVADFDRALDKYAQLITLQTPHHQDYVFERNLLNQEKERRKNTLKDNALARLKAMQDDLKNHPPLERIQRLEAIIAYCNTSPEGLHLNVAIQEARAKIVFEQSILEQFTQVQRLIASIDDLSGQVLLNCYQNILDQLATIIHRSPKEMEHYKTIRAQINRQKLEYEQGSASANIVVEDIQLNRRDLGGILMNPQPNQAQHAAPEQRQEFLQLQFNR